MNLAELRAEREKAGLAYAESVSDLRSKWIRLAAIERTLCNQNVAPDSVKVFHFTRRQMEDGLRSLQHHEFVPRIIAPEWEAEAAALSDLQIEGYQA
ncbi:hypothetical protein JQ615_01100 [Bradyrhizobium jicamae]|uniref:Uncharacterized protein n=1 Tax=Bradyrhizobium jicamae TaxID=280332 RepID=A0ABS5FB15_9BRAD|nr:hypothetical protein [Bradyrhizobium jicamae]MBR0793978.1 hypothetical protein [Bradyrhizobium jicamae]